MFEIFGRSWSPLLAVGILIASSNIDRSLADERPVTGPETEKRFPPLQVPDGFRATLFACDPLVEYPSVIAAGPEAGTLFVAHDYVTGLGVEIVRRDEIRLVRDTDGDGYADQSTLYADGFNSIQGLAYHAGTVYVMHAPLLTSLSDTDGDGTADARRDLLRGLGLPPEENSNRLHCANGVVVGHDGWLYLALGDRGCDVLRPEGDRLLFREGGILRCRPDGRDLHVFAHGLRNIYDVALDTELNVFVRDNENDGGDYMIRVCHCFHGSDHGYPYLYYEHPDEAMPPLADLGRGSSAGGTAYLETAFPPEYRDSLFFCEWGRAVVRYRPQRAGSTFAPLQEIDFATGAPDDPYGFKPTDLVVDRDGSLLVSDWCDGQRPKRGRGRIYRITFPGSRQQPVDPHDVSSKTDLDELLKFLGSNRYWNRVAAQRAIEQRGPAVADTVKQAMHAGHVAPLGRLHGVWILAHLAGEAAIADLFDLAETDPDPRVRAQSVRALADLTDPILKTHRLAAGRGDEGVCRRLAELGENADPRVRLEVLIALGRLHWRGAPQWLRRNWRHPDPALTHAAMMLLRRADNWPDVLKLLDVDAETTGVAPPLRTLALLALANRANETIVDGLLARLQNEADPQRRREYLGLLARVYKKPAEWTYWGFRPAPRPPNSVAWERSERIAKAFDDALIDPDSSVRAFAVRQMLREAIPVRDEALTRWLKQETDPDAVAAILEALKRRPPAETRDRLETIARSKSQAAQNRLSALAMFVRGLDATTENSLLDVAGSLDDGVVLAAVLRELGRHASINATSVFLAEIDSADDDVRAAAVESLVKRPVDAVTPRVAGFLLDRDIRVRRAAATLAGELKVHDAVKRLLASAEHPDLPLRAASLKSLAILREPAAVPLAVKACNVPETQLAALACLAAVGGPQHRETVTAVAQVSRSIDVLSASVRTLTTWQEQVARGSDEWLSLERAVAEIQAASGLPLVWRVQRVASLESAQTLIRHVADPARSDSKAPQWAGWRRQMAEGTEARMNFEAAGNGTANSVVVAVTELFVDAPQEMEFFASADGKFRVWLNGREVFARESAAGRAGGFNPPARSERFDATLKTGLHRLLVQVVSNRDDSRLQLRFRRKSSQAEHERLTRLALEGQGNIQRGRELFMNAEKSQCLTCHRFGEQGGRIGPDLAGIGSRFSRIHLIESILEPSRTVAPSYETWIVVVQSGRVVTGVKVSETETLLTLGDNQGKTHKIPKSEIDDMQVKPQSTMPDGLEKQLTDREFVDLIGFLLSQKKAPSK